MPTNDTPGAGSKADGGGMMNTIQQQASSALSSQKTRAADSMTAVIEAIRQTGGQLREKNGVLAGYADSAAGQLERWSTQLRDRDVSDLMDDVSAFARRRPAVFIGSGLAIGLVAARFLKSSAPSGSSSRGMGQATQRFATSPSMGSMGSRPMSSGSMGSSSTMRDSSSSSMAADRSGSRTPKTPRTRTRADER